ncbi:hypothetical protein [uncultured Methanolobus sp.]|uniref:hypothetical protein n=1 Tax=uncultured Methanolobus sp. TaxID=218300 RepID=UPI0029C61536|nr:hypothetical protein [uncultured Methanolobus sp.]
MHLAIVEKAINMLHNTKGIDKAFLLDKNDIEKIIEFEKKDEQMDSLYFGKKHNIGVKKALVADILIAFVTNKEYEWPKDNLKIIHRGEIIGRDISNTTEIKRYMNSNDHCVFGNIVINFRKMKELKHTNEPPLMIINANPWTEIEKIDLVSEALIASPSRMTDKYIKSKLSSTDDLHIGTFIVGLKLIEKVPKETKIAHIIEN